MKQVDMQRIRLLNLVCAGYSEYLKETGGEVGVSSAHAFYLRLERNHETRGFSATDVVKHLAGELPPDWY